MSENRWLQMIEQNPGHSAWYIERFRTMAAAGDDLDGEARLIDAMAPRGARILDAGCGPGRVGAELAARGHRVVGVDVDPVLIEAAEAESAADSDLPAHLQADLRDGLRALARSVEAALGGANRTAVGQGPAPVAAITRRTA